MNANQMITKLTFAEVNPVLQPDTRRMMREERQTLTAAAKSGSPEQIADAMQEAIRVAKMWGVAL